jgi:hypothetical protein
MELATPRQRHRRSSLTNAFRGPRRTDTLHHVLGHDLTESFIM